MAEATTAPLGSAQDRHGLHTLAAGPMRATVRPGAGGRVASLWREEPGGRSTDVLVPMPDGDFDPLSWPKAGIYPLVPYSNRIRNATFRFGESHVELAPHPATRPHALHGFCQMRAWTVTRHSQAHLEMRYRHDPDDGQDSWPWAFEASQRVALDPAGMTHEIGVESRAAAPMPVGLGLHPYFAVSPGDRVRFSSEILWEADAEGCGLRPQALSGSARMHDSEHGSAEITAYHADWNGSASIERRDGTLITIQASAPLDHLVHHVPAGGGYLCLEPVSHVADAFNLAAAGATTTGMHVLYPGEAIRATIRIGLS